MTVPSRFVVTVPPEASVTPTTVRASLSGSVSPSRTEMPTSRAPGVGVKEITCGDATGGLLPAVGVVVTGLSTALVAEADDASVVRPR